jgi:aspartate/methionine/tyrosine aminotransferase
MCYGRLRMFSKRTNWNLASNALTRALEGLRQSGTPVTDLTISNPTRCGFAFDEEAMAHAFQGAGLLDYDPQAKGLLQARKVVAEYYAQDHSVQVDPETICLTSGTSEGYSFVFRLLCNPGDEILVPKPSYPLLEFLADLQDVKLVPYALEYAHGWFIDRHSLEQALTNRTRAIVLIHPNNPTGSFVHEEEQRFLGEICARHELALIADEVFLDYPYDGARRASFAANRDCLTFTLSGLSKIAALPQMKAAWIVTTGPDTAAQAALERLEVIADTYLSVSTPIQLAYPVLFELRHSLKKQILARVLENRERLRQESAANRKFELQDAAGGWNGVLKIFGARSADAIALELLERQHTLVHPGHFYDFPSDDRMVVSLLPPVSEFREGIRRLQSLL